LKPQSNQTAVSRNASLRSFACKGRCHPFRAVACLSRQTQGVALCCHIAPFQGWQSAKFGYVQKTPLQKASGYSSPERAASNCDGHRPSIKNTSTTALKGWHISRHIQLCFLLCGLQNYLVEATTLARSVAAGGLLL
jgi:hypothetical protein